jgi:hypothetical protein
MYVAATILGILLAFVVLVGQDLSLGVHARGVVRPGPQTATQRHLRTTSVTHGPQPRAGPLHRSGRSIGDRGPIVGLLRRPLGVAALVGFAALLIGAVGFHARAGDYADSKLHTQAITPVALFLGIRRRRHTRADHVTELTVTLSSAPMTMGGRVRQQMPSSSSCQRPS